MRINFDLGELAAFVAVAERMNFRAASEALFISPSALSRRIDRIEEALGVRLFDRTTRRVSLTEDGEQFLAHAGEALAALQHAISDVGDRAERRAGLVTVACIPSVANHLLPEVLARFAQLQPDTRIKMLDHSAPQVLKAVVEKQADFGVNFLGAQEPSIDFSAIVKERYVLAVPARHRLATLRSVGWEEFVGERFISLAADSGNRMLLDNAVAQAKARPVTHVEVNHVEGALTRPQVSRTLGLITRKGHRLSSQAEVLAKLLVQALKQAGVAQAS